ncbi:MAG: ABC transporter substrate-binding protein [Magnetococcales bacterium]|nr:TRAP transporter substrate-binding protein DctP [Magnetococcales bacterium]NGZ04945.1 ABC transporter substrate-binding protein [Magnetococcales bacterium]
MSEKRFRQILMLFLGLVLALLAMRLGNSFLQPLPVGNGRDAERVLTLRLGMASTIGPVEREAVQRLAGQLATPESGTVRLSLHSAVDFGGDERMLELASRGELSMILVPLSCLARRIEAVQVLDLPFMFPTREAFQQVLADDFGRLLLDKVRRLGLEGLAIWDGGSRHWLADRPLLEPEQFAGLSVWAGQPENRITPEFMTRLGAQSVPGIAAEFSVETETPPVQDVTLWSVRAVPAHGGQRHLTLSGHAQTGYLLAMSRDALDMLTAHDQERLLELVRELSGWQRAEVRTREMEVLQELGESGIIVHALLPEGRASFQHLGAVLARQFEEQIGSDVMARLEERLLLPVWTGQQEKPVLVGLDAQLSGESALVGLELRRGVQFALAEINERGGVLGRPIHLVTRDNHGLATRGLDNLKFFAGLDPLVAVMGGQKSSVVSSEIDAVHELGLPMLLPWSAARNLTENGYTPNQVFRFSLNDRWTAPFLAKAALARSHRIALVLENSGWGHQFAEILRRHLHAFGIHPELVYWVENGLPGGTADLLSRLAESRAEAVILVDTPGETIPLLLDLARHLPTVAVVSHWGLLGARLTPEELAILAHMDLVFPQTFFPDDPANPAQEELVRRARRYFGQVAGALPPALGSGFLHAYELTRMLAAAMRAAGSSERRVVRATLESLPLHESVIKRLTVPFAENRHDALGVGDYHLGRIAADGRVVPVSARP